MRFRLPAGALYTLSALWMIACSPAVTGGGAGRPTYSDAFQEELEAVPELAQVLETIDAGQCREALPLLTVYVGREHRESALAHYLTGRAWLCTGESLKGVHHLEKAWIAGPAIRGEIRRAAKEGARALLAQYEARGALTFAQLKATYQLHAFGDETWYSDNAAKALTAYADRLVSRGDFKRVLSVVRVMQRVGVPAPAYFRHEILALVRLGELERMQKRVGELLPVLPPPAGDSLHAVAEAAEEGFRHKAAAWLYEQALANQCSCPDVRLDLARARLKAQQPDKARQAWETYLQERTEEQRKDAYLKVATLLVRHDQYAQAREVLARGRDRYPDEFVFYRALVSLHEKAPDLVAPATVLSEYLTRRNNEAEALVEVGDLALEWRLSKVGRQLFDAVEKKGVAPALSAFYRGAFAWQEGQRKPAERLFDRAVDKAARPAAMLDRVATFFLDNGDPDAAGDYFEKALRRDPGNVTVLLKLAGLREKEKPGAGLELLQERVRRHRLTADGYGELAGWAATRRFAEAALAFARQGLAAAPAGRRAGPATLLGSLQLEQGETAAALESFATALEDAGDDMAALGRVLDVAGDRDEPAVACFVYEEANARRQALAPAMLAPAARASLRCGKPDRTFLSGYLQSTQEPAQALAELLELAHDEASRQALATVVEDSKREWREPELAARLMVLYADLGNADQALAYARNYAAQGREPVRRMVQMGQAVLLEGAPAAALEVLRAAWSMAGNEDKQEFGLVYAALLFANDEEERGLQVVAELVSFPGRRLEFTALSARLLIDAGKPALAERICLEALRLPGGRQPDVKQLPVLKPGQGPSEANREEILATLSRAQDLRERVDYERQVVALLAFAWHQQGKSWSKLVATALPLVQGWHGEDLLAEVMHRLGAHEPARRLFREAFEKAPGNGELARRYVDSLVFEALDSGRKPESVQDDVSRIIKRFIKAREGDAEAYKLAATYLEGKGFFGLAEDLLAQLGQSTAMDAGVALALARAQASQGKIESAHAGFKVAAQLGACGAKTVEAALGELERVGRADLGLDLVADCRTRYPKDAHLHYLHARMLLEANGHAAAPEAVNRLQKTVLLDMDYVEEAVKLLRVWDLEERALPFVELLVTAKDVTKVLKGLELGFEILSRQGDLDGIKRLGARASRLHSKNTQLAVEVSGLYFRYNLVKQGLEKLEKAAAGGDDNTLLLLGIRLIASGKTQEGLAQLRAHFRTAVLPGRKQSGAMPEPVYKSFTVQLDFLRDQQLLEVSAELLAKVLERYPDDQRVRLRLMQVEALLGRFDALLPRFDEVVLSWPAGEEAQRQERLLELLRRAGRLEDAVTRIERRCQGEKAPGCLSYLATVYALTDSPQKLGLLVREAQSSKLRASRLLELAQGLIARGRYEAARPVLAESMLRAWGARSVLLQVHRAYARLYSARGQRARMADVNRMVLLQTASDLKLREELPATLIETEYLELADEQLRLLQLIQEKPPRAELMRFEMYLHAGRADEALALARHTAFQSENILNVLISFASLARSKLAFEIARDLYRVALDLDPTNQPLRFAAAELDLVLGRVDEARPLFEAWLGEQGAPPRRVREVAQNLCKYNRLGWARRLAEAAADAPEAWLAVGLCHLRAGKNDEGSALITRAVQADADRRADLAREVLLFAAPRPWLLPETLRTTLLDSGCPGEQQPAVCRFWRGVLHLDAGQNAQADAAFAGQLAGTDETWRYTLTAFRSYLRHGLTRPADRLLRKTMVGFNKEHVLNEAVKSVFAILEEETPSPETTGKLVTLAASYLDELLARNPYDFWFRTQRAELHLLANQPEQALALYEGYLRDTPWEPGLLNNVAYLYSKLNQNVDRGLELVHTALGWEPSHSAFYLDTRGWLLYRKGDYDTAERNIRQAIHRSHLGFGDSLSESLFHLGVTLAALQRQDDAVRYLEMAAFIDPFGEYGRRAREKLLEFAVDPFHAE